MTILGTAIGLRKKKGEGIVAGITYGIGIAFGYWVIHSLCVSFGHSGFLQPFVAAWLTSAVFTVVGLILLFSTD